VYEIDGVIHYGVCNMPAQTPRTSTIALAAATLPYILKLANEGSKVSETDAELRSALTCLNGELTNELTAKALGM
jgi:alanine dehydrogenase